MLTIIITCYSVILNESYLYFLCIKTTFCIQLWKDLLWLTQKSDIHHAYRSSHGQPRSAFCCGTDYGYELWWFHCLDSNQELTAQHPYATSCLEYFLEKTPTTYRYNSEGCKVRLFQTMCAIMNYNFWKFKIRIKIRLPIEEVLTYFGF